MTFKLLAVSAALIGIAVTGAVIPGICDEATPAAPVKVAAAVTIGAARAASSQMPGMTAPVTAKPISAAETASSLKVIEASSVAFLG